MNVFQKKNDSDPEKTGTLSVQGLARMPVEDPGFGGDAGSLQKRAISGIT